MLYRQIFDEMKDFSHSRVGSFDGQDPA